jgi:hypothetical protein
MLEPGTLTAPPFIAGLVFGVAGIALVAQARMQVRLLRRRLATGLGTEVIDPATGLFAEAAAWQCIRAEANRAHRLDRPLEIWVGTASSNEALEAGGRALVFDMPAGATGVRLAQQRICVVSCAGDASPERLLGEFDWRGRTIAPGDTAAQHALMFLSEEVA